MRTKSHQSTPRTEQTKPTPALHRLPIDQLRHLPRPRAGFEPFIELFEKLVAEHGDELGAGIDVEAMRTSFGKAQELASARQAAAANVASAQEQFALVDDTQTEAFSDGWKALLLIYGRALQAGRTNDQIEVAIEPFVRFMKNGPRQKKAATP